MAVLLLPNVREGQPLGCYACVYVFVFAFGVGAPGEYRQVRLVCSTTSHAARPSLDASCNFIHCWHYHTETLLRPRPPSMAFLACSLAMCG